MRVIGLDIQPHAVACVEMDSAFGRFEVRDTHEILVETGRDPYVAAAHMLASLPKKPDRLVMTVPVEISTFRNLSIASKDKKAIRSALEFELEDDLPFENNQLHYDSVILNSGPTGSTVHVGAAKKDSFRAYLAQLSQNQLDPDLVTTDAWAFRCLLGRIQGNAVAPPPLMLLGLEQHKTFFYIHDQNRPVLYREIPFGLQTIENEVVARLKVSHEEAKRYLRDIGVSEIDEQISNAIAEILDRLVPEIKQSELAGRATLRAVIEQVWVTGDGALIPGLMPWLAQATDKTVSLFRPMSLISPAQVTYSETSEVRFARAIAMALSTVALDRLPCLNLRRGEFLKTDAGGFSVFDLIKKPLPYFVILLTVLLATKTIESKYYQGKLDETDETLKRAVKSYFGGVSDSAVRNYLTDTSKLKKNIEGDLAKQRELAKLLAPNANSPFDFLRSLSQKIGKDIVLDLVSFDVGTDFTESYKENRPIKASLAFIVGSATSLSKLTDLLEQKFKFKKGTSEEVTIDGHKSFKIQFMGTP